jgi:hypothetical protein
MSAAPSGATARRDVPEQWLETLPRPSGLRRTRRAKGKIYRIYIRLLNS